MYRLNFLWASLLLVAFVSPVWAQDESSASDVSVDTVADSSVVDPKHPRLEALKELKNVTLVKKNMVIKALLHLLHQLINSLKILSISHIILPPF